MKKTGIFLLLLSAAILFFASCTPSPRYLRTKGGGIDGGSNYIRVLIGIESNAFNLKSDSTVRVIAQKSMKVVYEAPKGKLKFNPEKIHDVFLIESDSNIMLLNSNPYRGKIEIHNILGKVYIINIVRMEDYLCSVVPSEMPYSWHKEALKAQAIASRTYSYYHIKNRQDRSIYDLDATTRSQVYKGVSSEKPSTTEAVMATSGVIMTYNYQPILAYFHSTSGGVTADDSDVWKGSDLQYLRSVKCDSDGGSPHSHWQTRLTFDEIESALKKRYPRIGKIESLSFKKHNQRVVEVNIVHRQGNITMSGNEFRLMFPPQKLKSMLITARRENDSLLIDGSGWGHGVGMCQWGAKGQAEHGAKFEQILSHYYTGIKFSKIGNNSLAYKKDSVNLVN